MCQGNANCLTKPGKHSDRMVTSLRVMLLAVYMVTHHSPGHRVLCVYTADRGGEIPLLPKSHAWSPHSNLHPIGDSHTQTLVAMRDTGNAVSCWAGVSTSTPHCGVFARIRVTTRLLSAICLASLLGYSELCRLFEWDALPHAR